MADSSKPAWTREAAPVTVDEATRLADITPDWAWGGSDGSGVRVAIIDSGIDATHPALDGCVDTEGGVAFHVDPQGKVIRTDGPHDDAFGHATACAGIIHGVAPGATITSVKVLGQGLTGKAAAFLAGLTWATEQGFDVINLSLGTRKRDWALPFHDVCDRAYFEGSLVVTAANNVQRRSYPSLFASVASVACNTGTEPMRFHWNPDPPTEFLAYGIDVEVPWVDHQMISATGNSYAAPHISGIAALIKAKHPDLRPFQIKTVLWATAVNVFAAEQLETAGKLSRRRAGQR